MIGFHSRLQPDRPAPEAPRELIASRVSLAGVNLRWEPSPNRDQPVRYRVYRNHLLLASVGSATQFLDRSVQSGLRYSYSVVAEDLTGQASPASQPLSVTIPPPILLQADFEANTLADWTSGGTVLLQKQTGEANWATSQSSSATRSRKFTRISPTCHTTPAGPHRPVPFAASRSYERRQYCG